MTNRAPARHMTARSARRAVTVLAAAVIAAAACAQPDTATPPPSTTAASEAAPADSTQPEAATPTTHTTPQRDDTEPAPATTAQPAAADTPTADTDSTDQQEPTGDVDSDEVVEADDSAQEESDEIDSAAAGEVVDDPDGSATDPEEADEAAAEEPDETTEEDEDETAAEEPEDAAEETETAEPNYEGRSPDSVFPSRAYFDHDAIRALFPECAPPPPVPQWMVDHFARWDPIYAGWDTDSQRLSGLQIASGWWTDEQLAVWRPDSGITAASARRDGTYSRDLDTVLLWPVGPAPENKVEGYAYPYKFADGRVTMPTLYARAASRGYVRHA